MKGEKDVKPLVVLSDDGSHREMKDLKYGEEREIVREKAFMILITKIHNPFSLLFWLRKTFPPRDNNQIGGKKCRNRKKGEKLLQMTKENKISFWHAVYSRTSFASSLLILIVSESILKTFFTEQQTLVCQIHCKSLQGLCRTSPAAEHWHSLAKPRWGI